MRWRAGRADRRVRQEARDVQRALRQRRQFSWRAVVAGTRPADPVSGGVKLDRALARARGAIGAPFRLHGRELRGFDCVGLAAWAWQATAPTGYALRGSPRARIECELVRQG